MDATNPVPPIISDTTGCGTKDAFSAADHDEPYRFGRQPNARAPFPFNERQFARLLILRGQVQDVRSLDDGVAA